LGSGPGCLLGGGITPGAGRAGDLGYNGRGRALPGEMVEAMERGQIYWCDLEPRRGHEQGDVRPVVIVSANQYNGSRSPLVAVVPLTRSGVKNPLHVSLSSSETGMESDSNALIDHARFIDRSRLRDKPAGRLTVEAQQRLDRNLARVLGV
jgi:mRNA interferase MazF